MSLTKNCNLLSKEKIKPDRQQKKKQTYKLVNEISNLTSRRLVPINIK